MDLNNTFSGVEATPAQENEKKKMEKALKQDFQTKLANDAEFAAILGTQSKCLEVVNTLGYGRSGSLVHDKKASADAGTRKVKPASNIVGYTVKNVGDKPIQYETAVYSQDENGEYKAEQVTRTLEPGQEVALTRKYMTILTARPEFSFTLANGKMVVKLSSKNPEKIFDRTYFQFSEEAGCTVHDDAVKVAIDEEGPDGTNVIKPEYIETFAGVLVSKKSKKERTKSPKATVQEVMANYVHSLATEEA